jgi:hypothetical protein
MLKKTKIAICSLMAMVFIENRSYALDEQISKQAMKLLQR